MDPERIHAYLQAACAGLGFDIGEVWFSSSETGTSTVAAIESRTGMKQSRNRDMKFLQLYTSSSYKSRRNDLLRPESEDIPGKGSYMHQNERKKAGANDKENTLSKHVLSPKLVNAIANTAQVVWANCQESEGLLGRSDMRLQTAVGMPVAMDSEGNMCVVVMFSPKNVQSTTDAVEYLKSLSQGATSSSIPCLLPVIDSGAKRLEYNPKKFSDWEEHEDIEIAKQKSALALTNRQSHEQQNGYGKKTKEFQIADLQSDVFGIPMLPSFALLETEDAQRSANSTPSSDDIATANAFDQASYGLWSTIMQNPEISTVVEQIPDNAISAATQAQIPLANPPQAAAAAATPHLHPERKMRLEEFSSAFLSMSVFDIADVWIPPKNSVADHNIQLHLSFSLLSDEKNSSLIYFRTASEHTIIKGWDGAVGRAFCSGNAVWSANSEIIVDTGRTEAFAIANIQTAFAVPIFSSGSLTPSCVLCCYSLVRSDCVPFVLKFVQQALKTLWLGLENIEPHESIGKDLWKDVAPADLGVMAADLEMQKAFYRKKRPFEDIAPRQQQQAPQQTSQQATQQTSIQDDIIRQRSSSLALQMQTLTATDGSGSVPLNYNQHRPLNAPPGKLAYVRTQNLDGADKRKLAIQNHLQQAVQSVAHVKPITDYGGNMPKRVHIDIAAAPPKPAPAPPTVYHNTPPIQLNTPVENNFFTNGTTVQNVNGSNEVHIAPMTVQSINKYNTAPQLNGAQMNGGAQVFLQPQPQPVLSQNVAFVPAPAASIAPTPAPAVGSIPQLCMPIMTGNGVSSRQPIAPTHPPVKVCRIQGCEQAAVSRRPYCSKHSGNRLCEHPGCTKCAQGATRFCISHGGGRRCTFPGCDKGARDKFFCAAHGGGKRCTFAGCKKSAVGGSSLCTSHGGGRRCSIEGCQKSAQSSTNFCVKHGGGKKCAHAGCEKVARGRTLYCAGHGGGVRCKLEGCSRIAIGKMQLCRAHGGGSNRRKAT